MTASAGPSAPRRRGFGDSLSTVDEGCESPPGNRAPDLLVTAEEGQAGELGTVKRAKPGAVEVGGRGLDPGALGDAPAGVDRQSQVGDSPPGLYRAPRGRPLKAEGLTEVARGAARW